MNNFSLKKTMYEFFEPNLRTIYRLYKGYVNDFRNFFRIYDSERKLASDAQKYWDKDYSVNAKLAQDAHWKDKGIFKNHDKWLSLGKEHLAIVQMQTNFLNTQLNVKQIVEWGCGGGANAIHFAPFTDKFIGIDISKESLLECGKQLFAIGLENFQPLLIDASTPEIVLEKQISETDLFICTYVYELFPSPAYGLKVLEIAYKILKPGGIALIQIRYNDGRKNFKTKRWGYKLNATFMTSYTLEEFWKYSVDIGFEPINLILKPKQPLVNDMCYGYYLLKKK